MFGFFSSAPPPFNPETDIPDLSGKVIVITGANSGLGYQSLINFAKHNPSKIYLCARSRAKYDEAMEGITAAVPQASSFVKYLELDLTSLSSVKSAAANISHDNSHIDILMNNAGIMATPPGLTQEGYEIQFGTNHVGHFLFTKQLLPLLLQTAKPPSPSSPPNDVRIINLSSMGHKFAPNPTGFIPSTTTTDMATYSTWSRYGQSKLANILFTTELARRYPEITSVAIHPGSVETNLANPLLKTYPFLRTVLKPIRGWVSGPASVGCWNQTWAAVAPVKGRKGEKKGEGVGGEEATAAEVKKKPMVEQGKYYTPVAKTDPPSPFAQDANLAKELWEWSETELKRHGY